MDSPPETCSAQPRPANAAHRGFFSFCWRPRVVRLALWRVLQREPAPKEIERGVRLMARLQQQYGVSPDEALVRFCTVALNLNEFLYLD